MKKLTVLLAIVAALFAGYGFWWHQTASTAQTKLEKAVAKLQGEIAPNGTLQYDAINKGGFPFDISLALTNPRIEYTDDETEEHGSSGVEGQLLISKKLWDDAVTISVKGKQHYSLKIEDHPIFDINLDGDTAISYQGDIDSILKVLIPKSTGIDEDSSAHWKSFTSRWKEGSLTTPDTSIQHKAADISLVLNDNANTESTLDYSFNIKDLTITSDNTDDTLASSPWLHVINLLQISPQDYGKMNVILDGNFCFPPMHEWEPILNEPLAERKGRLCLMIDKFELQSDLVDSSLKNGELSLTQDGKDFTLRYDLKGKGNNNKQYDVVLKDKVENLLQDDITLQMLFPENEEAQDIIYDNAAKLAGLLPQFHRWGPVDSGIDLTVKATVENYFPTTLNVDLADLSYDTKQHSINLSGDYQSVQSFHKQHGSSTLQVSNYTALIDNIAHFYDNVANTINDLHIPNFMTLPLVVEGDVEDVNLFLKDISDHAARDNTLATTITYDEQNGLHVGRMDAHQFMERWQRLLMSLMDRHLRPASAK